MEEKNKENSAKEKEDLSFEEIPNLDAKCSFLRDMIKGAETYVRSLNKHDTFKHEQAYLGQHKEMRAHIDIAIRCLEDARMRMGKVLQYAGDGESIYDKV